MEERTFADQHGVAVFWRWWPVDVPRAVVQVAHGASEHSGRYARFANAAFEPARVTERDHRDAATRHIVARLERCLDTTA